MSTGSEANSEYESDAEELLRRALIDDAATVSVALKVSHLPLCDTVTVIFHGRRDLATVQTYVTPGQHLPGETLSPNELLRVPCDLDLAEAGDLGAAEELYAEQAAALRDALIGADTVLDLWRDQLNSLLGESIKVDHAIELTAPLPAPRLLPVVLHVAERDLLVAPVCSARTLAQGRPPLGIACVQQDVARVYPLPEDPQASLEDFLGHVADRAHGLAREIERQEASVDRFFQLSSEDDLPQAG